MSSQDSQNTRAVEQIAGAAAGVGGTRAALSLSLVVALVCMLVAPLFAPAEAVIRSSPANAPAAPGDEYWAAGFEPVGMSGGTVKAVTAGPDGSLYTGGWFTTVGGIAVNNVARWDGGIP